MIPLMRKRYFILLLLPLSFIAPCMAQVEKKLPGIWEGKLNMGIELRIIFHIRESSNGSFTATADSPDQSAFGLKCDTIIVSAENIRIEMHGLNAVFAGKISADTTIDGTFTQRVSFPLSLKKVDRPSERKRPQTPRPPFPYKSEDVEYDNADKTLHYGATITIPPGDGPFPAALLITGSGPQDRDENIMGHKLFAVLADALSRNGFVVLRVDDRGVGKSTGNFSDATSADFAGDAGTSFDYLLSRPEVDKKKAGLIGHSEGGMIAPIVATGRNDIGFIVLLAAPGIRSDELMAEQHAAIFRSAGVSSRAVDAYIPFLKNLMHEVAVTDSAHLPARITSMAQQWEATTDTTLLKELGISMEKGTQEMSRNLAEQFSGKWFRHFLAFDPKPYLQKLTCKVLALNGSKDIQVIPSSNLAGIEAALKKSGSKNYTVSEMQGLNHLFQTCTKCTLAEYGELEETFSPAALQIITDWLIKNVK
jgi:uncharacterized protein